MVILGISCFYHDSAAAIIRDGVIIAAVQEERFTRKKHDPAFPANAIKYCLKEAGVSLDELDAVAFYDKPFLKFERLIETYYAFAPRGLRSFITLMPIWLKEKMFLKSLLRTELKGIEAFDKKKLKILFPEHHLSHAASAYYPSGYTEAAILTVDGVGEWATASICHGKGQQIEILKELHFPHSLGLLYSTFTYYLGFRVNSGEYKLMGLAPYGNPDSEQTQRFIKLIAEELVDIKEDGSLRLNQKYFNYATGLRMANDSRWQKLFGFKRREGEANIEQIHCNMAYAIQYVTEGVVLNMAKEAKALTGAKVLCMAGGVALNCVANGKLKESGIFDEIFIQPAAGDAGGALGAALVSSHIFFDEPLADNAGKDTMQGAYLGPEYTDTQILKIIDDYDAAAEKLSPQALLEKTATVLDKGHVVGWFQGRMEFGPRALGNRSILGDPRNKDMQKKLNLKIKYRESFRPFAPLVLEEEVKKYFNMNGNSPYMLMVHQVQNAIKKEVPAEYQNTDMRDKLYYERSTLPAITHVDFSARIQTVSKERNGILYDLMQAFKQKTGCGVLVNTSFNVRGEPIVCTPEDAYRCFMRTEMDYLVMGNYIFKKADQPTWPEGNEWQQTYELD